MRSLDTNVLVRHLAQDDEQQSPLATTLIKDSGADESLFIPLSVVVELKWVLRASYSLSKQEIIKLLSDLLETRQIKFHEEESVERAVHIYRSSRANFADCLHLACAFTQSALPLVTFDKTAANLDGIELLAATKS